MQRNLHRRHNHTRSTPGRFAQSQCVFLQPPLSTHEGRAAFLLCGKCHNLQRSFSEVDQFHKISVFVSDENVAFTKLLPAVRLSLERLAAGHFVSKQTFYTVYAEVYEGPSARANYPHYFERDVATLLETLPNCFETIELLSPVPRANMPHHPGGGLYLIDIIVYPKNQPMPQVLSQIQRKLNDADETISTLQKTIQSLRSDLSSAQVDLDALRAQLAAAQYSSTTTTPLVLANCLRSEVQQFNKSTVSPHQSSQLLAKLSACTPREVFEATLPKGLQDFFLAFLRGEPQTIDYRFPVIVSLILRQSLRADQLVRNYLPIQHVLSLLFRMEGQDELLSMWSGLGVTSSARSVRNVITQLGEEHKKPQFGVHHVLMSEDNAGKTNVSSNVYNDLTLSQGTWLNASGLPPHAPAYAPSLLDLNLFQGEDLTCIGCLGSVFGRKTLQAWKNFSAVYFASLLISGVGMGLPVVQMLGGDYSTLREAPSASYIMRMLCRDLYNMSGGTPYSSHCLLKADVCKASDMDEFCAFTESIISQKTRDLIHIEPGRRDQRAKFVNMVHHGDNEVIVLKDQLQQIHICFLDSTARISSISGSPSIPFLSVGQTVRAIGSPSQFVILTTALDVESAMNQPHCYCCQTTFCTTERERMPDRIPQISFPFSATGPSFSTEQASHLFHDPEEFRGIKRTKISAPPHYHFYVSASPTQAHQSVPSPAVRPEPVVVPVVSLQDVVYDTEQPFRKRIRSADPQPSLSFQQPMSNESVASLHAGQSSNSPVDVNRTTVTTDIAGDSDSPSPMMESAGHEPPSLVPPSAPLRPEIDVTIEFTSDVKIIIERTGEAYVITSLELYSGANLSSPDLKQQAASSVLLKGDTVVCFNGRNVADCLTFVGDDQRARASIFEHFPPDFHFCSCHKIDSFVSLPHVHMRIVPGVQNLTECSSIGLDYDTYRSFVNAQTFRHPTDPTFHNVLPVMGFWHYIKCLQDAMDHLYGASILNTVRHKMNSNSSSRQQATQWRAADGVLEVSLTCVAQAVINDIFTTGAIEGFKSLEDVKQLLSSSAPDRLMKLLDLGARIDSIMEATLKENNALDYTYGPPVNIKERRSRLQSGTAGAHLNAATARGTGSDVPSTTPTSGPPPTSPDVSILEPGSSVSGRTSTAAMTATQSAPAAPAAPLGSPSETSTMPQAKSLKDPTASFLYHCKFLNHGKGYEAALTSMRIGNYPLSRAAIQSLLVLLKTTGRANYQWVTIKSLFADAARSEDLDALARMELEFSQYYGVELSMLAQDEAQELFNNWYKKLTTSSDTDHMKTCAAAFDPLLLLKGGVLEAWTHGPDETRGTSNLSGDGCRPPAVGMQPMAAAPMSCPKVLQPQAAVTEASAADTTQLRVTPSDDVVHHFHHGQTRRNWRTRNKAVQEAIGPLMNDSKNGWTPGEFGFCINGHQQRGSISSLSGKTVSDPKIVKQMISHSTDAMRAVHQSAQEYIAAPEKDRGSVEMKSFKVPTFSDITPSSGPGSKGSKDRQKAQKLDGIAVELMVNSVLHDDGASLLRGHGAKNLTCRSPSYFTSINAASSIATIRGKRNKSTAFTPLRKLCDEAVDLLNSSHNAARFHYPFAILPIQYTFPGCNALATADISDVCVDMAGYVFGKPVSKSVKTFGDWIDKVVSELVAMIMLSTGACNTKPLRRLWLCNEVREAGFVGKEFVQQQRGKATKGLELPDWTFEFSWSITTQSLTNKYVNRSNMDLILMRIMQRVLQKPDLLKGCTKELSIYGYRDVGFMMEDCARFYEAENAAKFQTWNVSVAGVVALDCFNCVLGEGEDVCVWAALRSPKSCVIFSVDTDVSVNLLLHSDMVDSKLSEGRGCIFRKLASSKKKQHAPVFLHETVFSKLLRVYFHSKLTVDDRTPAFLQAVPALVAAMLINIGINDFVEPTLGAKASPRAAINALLSACKSGCKALTSLRTASDVRNMESEDIDCLTMALFADWRRLEIRMGPERALVESLDDLFLAASHDVRKAVETLLWPRTVIASTVTKTKKKDGTGAQLSPLSSLDLRNICPLFEPMVCHSRRVRCVMVKQLAALSSWKPGENDAACQQSKPGVEDGYYVIGGERTPALLSSFTSYITLAGDCCETPDSVGQAGQPLVPNTTASSALPELDLLQDRLNQAMNASDVESQADDDEQSQLEEHIDPTSEEGSSSEVDNEGDGDRLSGHPDSRESDEEEEQRPQVYHGQPMLPQWWHEIGVAAAQSGWAVGSAALTRMAAFKAGIGRMHADAQACNDFLSQRLFQQFIQIADAYQTAATNIDGPVILNVPTLTFSQHIPFSDESIITMTTATLGRSVQRTARGQRPGGSR